MTDWLVVVIDLFVIALLAVFIMKIIAGMT